MRTGKGAYTLLLSSMLCAGGACAQSNSGSISGQVHDPARRPVPNASVVIVDTDLNTRRTVITDSSGFFRATGLPPGAFMVEASTPDLKTRRPLRLTLALGSSVRADLSLALPSVPQKAAVTARGQTSEGNTLAPPVNKDEASLGSFFAGNTITYLPNRDRDVSQFVQLGGGAVEDPSGEGVDIAGQRSASVVTQVDGVSFNDALHGGPRGATDGTFLLPQTTVREFQIARSGVTPEVSGTNSGLVNVATKEGSNKLRAEAFYSVRPAWAASAEAFGHSLGNRQNVFGGSAGGPLRKDTLFYYAGFEQNFLDAPYYTQFAPQASGATLPAALLALQGEVPHRTTPTALSLRTDAVLNPANSLNLQFAANRVRATDVADGSSRSLATADHADALSGQSVWSKAALTTLLTQRTLNRALISWSGDHRTFTPKSAAPELDILGVGTLGGDSLGPQLYTARQLQGLDSVSVVRGRASLDFGVAFFDSPAYQTEEANLHGRLDYISLAAYLVNSPRRYQQTFVSGDVRYSGTVRQLGAFAMAKQPLGGRASMTAGLRWDGEWNPPPPRPNAAVSQTQRVPNDLAQWQPRVGIAWTPGARTVVRVSAGLYTASTPATLFHRVSADNGTETVVADSDFDPQILTLAGAGPPLSAPPAGLRMPRALVAGIDAGFRNPRALQCALGLEQEIGRGQMVSAGYVHGSTWRLERRLDTNLSPPVLGLHGLPIFPSARPNPAIGRLLVEESNAHASYDGLLVSATSQIGRRSQVLFNYTLSHTRDDDSNAGPYSIDSALNPYHLQAERGASSLDVRHLLNLSAVVNLPYGLKCNPILLLRSGRPSTPIVGYDLQHDSNDWNDRAILNGVEAARNSLRQPAFTDLDLRLVKDFTLKGAGHHLDLFVDIFNLGGASNRSFGPEAVSAFGTAGAPIASAGLPLFAPDGTRMGGPREIQFTARLVAF